MDMKNLPVGTKVRTTEIISARREAAGGRVLTQFFPGTEVTITQVYNRGTADTAYQVEGVPTNYDWVGTGLAFHDEIEEV